MEQLLPDIPRVYTAIAEWSACLMFVCLMKKRFCTWKVAGISALMLLAQTLFLHFTGNVMIYFWIPCMAVAVIMMMFYIYSCCKISRMEAAYFGIHAFVTAEFSASLAWQITVFFLPEWITRIWGAPIVIQIVSCMVVNLLMWNISKNHLPKDRQLDIGYKQFISTFIIGIAIFATSNLSFLSAKTPFSGVYSIEIANIRTLVDLGGVAMLYAHFVQCSENKIRRELESVENVLQNQYQQYKQSRESIDLINYKYHDLKHQIAVLKSEEDPAKRIAYLDKMEEDIKQYELQNKTGNKVLDTVLTSKSLYCDKHGITLTCVADGTLLDFMDTMDICSIFGNALDNAIECEKKIPDKEKRLIHVTVTKQKNFLMMRFENYFEGSLTYKEGKLVTTKKEKEFHGYGIKSIRYTVNKYEGAVSIDTEDSWFDLKILIPIKEET